MDHLLNRTNIVVPTARKYSPITLPYGYQSVLDVEKVDTANLDRIIEDTRQFTAALESKHNSRIEAFQTWKSEIVARDQIEKRRIAPGYLDTSDHLLVPHKAGEDSTQ